MSAPTLEELHVLVCRLQAFESAHSALLLAILQSRPGDLATIREEFLRSTQCEADLLLQEPGFTEEELQLGREAAALTLHQIDAEIASVRSRPEKQSKSIKGRGAAK